MPPEVSVETPQKPPSRQRRVWKVLGTIALGVLCLFLSLWAIAALYFDLNFPSLRLPAAIIYGVGVVCIWWFVRSRRVAALLIITAFTVVLIRWLTLLPTNERKWQPDVAILPSAEISGDRLAIRNIRNCHYRSESDFDVRHYDKTFDLQKLRTADLFLIYWGSPSIAHTMVSFGFDGGDYVCISIETRKEVGETYSAIRGFFRQFELTYVIADERDLVRLRTDLRKEQVYVYRLGMTPEQVRAVLLSYLQTANELVYQPRWYNALTLNCTTAIRVHADRARQKRPPLDWRTILNGYGDEMLYERHRIDTSLPFAELKKRSFINDRATAASDEDFSGAIRKGVPGMNN